MPRPSQFALMVTGLCCLLAGCSTTRQVDTYSGQDWSLDTWSQERPFAELEKELDGQEVLIELGDGVSHKGTDFRMDASEAAWWDPTAHQVNTVPTDQVWRLQTKNHGKGAAQGFRNGFLIGGTVGLMLDAGENFDWFPVGTLAIGLPAALIGTIAGSAGGSTITYVINPEYEPDRPPAETIPPHGSFDY